MTQVDDAPSDFAPRAVGPYWIRSATSIGENVYLAERAEDHALRLLVEYAEPLPAGRVRLARKGPHPRLMHIYAQVTDAQGKSFVDLDYVLGSRLDRLSKAPSPVAAVRISSQLAEALALLHNHGLCGFAEAAFLVNADQTSTQLFDYAGWHALPGDKRGRAACIQRDLYFVAKTLYRLASGHKQLRANSRTPLDGTAAPLNAIILNAIQGRYPSAAAFKSELDRLAQSLMAVPQRLSTVNTGTLPSSAKAASEAPHLTKPSPPPVEPKPLARLDVGCATDRGRVRERNEDNLLALPSAEGEIEGGLFVVADGMGGHSAGEVASDLAVKSLRRSAQSDRPRERASEPVRARLSEWVQRANKEVFDAVASGYNGMGTTLTAALVLEDCAYVANVGDSRTYLCRAGALQRISQDHSLVMSLVQAKIIAADDLYIHPRRNEIYRALGMDANAEVDVFGPIQLAHGDSLLLCSDGLWEMVRDPEIQATLVDAGGAQAACDELVRLANAHGGEDNITVVVVRVVRGVAEM